MNEMTPKQALNKAYLKLKPGRSQVEDFKAALLRLLDSMNSQESEEHHKNLLSDFLKKTNYDGNHFINTKGRTDLVIHNGKTGESAVGVIIEVKNPTNKSEMPRRDDLNSKAMQELVLYYLRERLQDGNLEIRNLVITNACEWYIFDARVFERCFAHSSELVRKFGEFSELRLSGTTTDFFYREIASPAIEAAACELPFTYIDLRTYEAYARDADRNNDRKLIEILKILAPEHLLKLPFANDSNTLDQGFYAELLHLIGLQEVREGSKKVIQRRSEGARNPGSLLENDLPPSDVPSCRLLTRDFARWAADVPRAWQPWQ